MKFFKYKPLIFLFIINISQNIKAEEKTVEVLREFEQTTSAALTHVTGTREIPGTSPLIKCLNDYTKNRRESRAEIGFKYIISSRRILEEYISKNQPIIQLIPLMQNITTETRATQFITCFFKLCLLIRLINNRYTEYFSSNEQHKITSSIEISTDKKRVEFGFFRHKLYRLIASYQQKHDPTILSKIIPQSIFSYIQKHKEDDELISFKVLAQTIGELYEIIINGIFKEINPTQSLNVPQAGLKKEVKNLQEFNNFFKMQYLKIAFYYMVKSSHEDDEEGGKKLLLDILESNPDIMPLYDTSNNNNLACYNSETSTLEIHLPEKFTDEYFRIYNLATNNGRNSLTIEFQDFFDNTISVPITPNITGVIEGYQAPKGIIGRVEDAAKSASSRVEKSVNEIKSEVDDLMQLFGLDDSPSKPKPKSKKAQQKQAEKNKPKQTLKAEKSEQSEASSPAVAGAAASAEPERAEDIDDTNSIYTYNKGYNKIAIGLFPRVQMWYSTTLDNPRTLERQGYLNRDNLQKQAIVTKVQRKYDCDRNEALKKIIFTHQLPYELIRTVLTWGKMNELADKVEFSGLILVKSPNVNGYYLADIVGKKKSENYISIFHSFLKDIQNVQEFVNNIVNDQPNEEAKPEADANIIPDEKDDEGEWQFKSNWKTEDRGATIVISQGDVSFTFFKQ